ncbi:MAG TPA: histidinol dehydrogenase, partial [Marinobacter sp.]|nr:histidinol dehydrogenase [Marinobacter sp.]
MTNLSIKRLTASDADFNAELDRLLAWDDSVDQQVNESVRHILHQVKTRGDAAVLEFTGKFDRLGGASGGGGG